MKQYTTEERIKYILDSEEWIHNKKFPSTELNFRPDFVNHKLKIVIEFDGYIHYNKSKTILGDYTKDDLLSRMGYVCLRIPYFLQLTEPVFKTLLPHVKYNEEYLIKDYPHGFIDKSCLKPIDFNEQGFERFLNDLRRLKQIGLETEANDIISSLSEEDITERQSIELDKL